ncbi:unnamed protein product [Enterobius vermicularis]|uniref:EB domain-containing protein n=1 Tax=Enterobius vermicularis TaxID=51028 RepID=A0A0N4V7L3_ENTVE|nr:unnamed protein product [Enterobius vermicularis]
MSATASMRTFQKPKYLTPPSFHCETDSDCPEDSICSFSDFYKKSVCERKTTINEGIWVDNKIDRDTRTDYKDNLRRIEGKTRVVESANSYFEALKEATAGDGAQPRPDAAVPQIGEGTHSSPNAGVPQIGDGVNSYLPSGIPQIGGGVKPYSNVAVLPRIGGGANPNPTIGLPEIGSGAKPNPTIGPPEIGSGAKPNPQIGGGTVPRPTNEIPNIGTGAGTSANAFIPCISDLQCPYGEICLMWANINGKEIRVCTQKLLREGKVCLFNSQCRIGEVCERNATGVFVCKHSYNASVERGCVFDFDCSGNWKCINVGTSQQKLNWYHRLLFTAISMSSTVIC